jgi:hypothetical protein
VDGCSGAAGVAGPHPRSDCVSARLQLAARSRRLPERPILAAAHPRHGLARQSMGFGAAARRRTPRARTHAPIAATRACRCVAAAARSTLSAPPPLSARGHAARRCHGRPPSAAAPARTCATAPGPHAHRRYLEAFLFFEVKISVTCVIRSNSSHEFFLPQFHLLLQLQRV